MIRILLLYSTLCFSVKSFAEPLTKEFLQGQWSLDSSWFTPDYPGLVEEYQPDWPDDNIWIFEGDSVSCFNYPFAFLTKDYFRVDSDGIYRYNHYWALTLSWAESGKLVLGLPDGMMMRFRRDTLNDQTLKLLRTLQRDTLNMSLLTENYYMVTHFVPDDAEAYDFKPPVKMPMKISIPDTTEALKIIRSGTIYLKAGRRKRAFRVVGVEWDLSFYAHRSEFVSVDVPVLTLVPGDWWTGDSFRVVYRANEKEMAHKKR